MASNKYDRTTISNRRDQSSIGTRFGGTGPFKTDDLDSGGNMLVNAANDTGVGWAACEDADDGYNVEINFLVIQYIGNGLDGNGNLQLILA